MDAAVQPQVTGSAVTDALSTGLAAAIVATSAPVDRVVLHDLVEAGRQRLAAASASGDHHPHSIGSVRRLLAAVIDRDATPEGIRRHSIAALRAVNGERSTHS